MSANARVLPSQSVAQAEKNYPLPSALCPRAYFSIDPSARVLGIFDADHER